MRRYADIIADMSALDAGTLLQAIYAYDAGREVPEMSDCVRPIYRLIRADMDAHARHYREVCERNRRNAQTRWTREKNEPDLHTENNAPVDTAVYDSVRSHAAAADKAESADSRQPGTVVQMLVGPDRDRFEKFWEAYPRKEARARAESAWGEIRPDDDLTQIIIDAINTARAMDPRFATKQYTPHPGNWLRNREWESEYSATAEDVDYGSWTPR